MLDPVLGVMMEAVHRYEGTVNQVLGDGVMAIFGAPVAHENHAVRAAYAALRMHEEVHRLARDLRRAEGVDVQIRVGLNSGEVVVRAIDNDLHMDYNAVGQTTYLAAQMAPGPSRLDAARSGNRRLTEGFLAVTGLGPGGRARRSTTPTRWPGPARSRCARWRRSATSGWASWRAARGTAPRRKSGSPRRWACSARWTCGTGCSRPSPRCATCSAGCLRPETLAGPWPAR